jgi:hypothetical protein
MFFFAINLNCVHGILDFHLNSVIHLLDSWILTKQFVHLGDPSSQSFNAKLW